MTYELYLEDEEYDFTNKADLDSAIERITKNANMDGYDVTVTTPNYPYDENVTLVYIDLVRK